MRKPGVYNNGQYLGRLAPHRWPNGCLVVGWKLLNNDNGSGYFVTDEEYAEAFPSRYRHYRAQAEDLGVIPELVAANDIFTQQKNLLEMCRLWHQGEPVERTALNTVLDNLDEIVTVVRLLAEDRYG